jgi:hypothetical protein
MGELLKNRKGESLDSLFTRLIAEKEGVATEKITVEYIRQQREKRFYPFMRYDIGCDYGGYDDDLHFYTRDEFDEIEKKVDEVMSHI